MLVQNIPDEQQADALSVGLGREERREKFGLHFLWDSFTRIGNDQHRVLCRSLNRDSAGSAFHAFCRVLDDIDQYLLKQSPVSNKRSMIIQTPHFVRLDDQVTLVRTKGFPLISEINSFRPKEKNPHIHGSTDFNSSQQKCLWQSIAASRASAVSILQVLMSAPVPNPYDVLIDISSCSYSLALINFASQNELEYVFPRFSGNLYHYMGLNIGQLIVNMKAASVALKTFQPKINFLARTIMKMSSANQIEFLNAKLDELSDLSDENYEDSQFKIQQLIENGRSNDCQYALPWL